MILIIRIHLSHLIIPVGKNFILSVALQFKLHLLLTFWLNRWYALVSTIKWLIIFVNIGKV